MQSRRITALLAMFAAGIVGIASGGAHAETGVTNDAIIVGQSAPMSGPAAKLGQQMNRGAQLYFNAVNAAGGINGRKIELKVLDDFYEPDATARNTKTLIEDTKVFALFGYVGTPTSLAALKIANPAGVPFFAPYSGASALREPFARNVFHVRASYNDETAAIVQQIHTTGLKRIAVIYNDDAYGKAGLDGVQRALKLPANKGVSLVAQASVVRNTTDVKSAITTVLEQKPDVVVVISAYQTVAALVKGAQEQGYAGQFYNVSFVGTKALANALGKAGGGVIISQVMPYPYSGASPVVRDYQKLLKSDGITDFDYGSIEGYVAARVFVEGLKRAGRDLTREKFVGALETMGNYDVGGFNVNFSPSNHVGSKFVEMTIINSNGQVIR
ncbi:MULTISPECIES: ABC transporter substrate-binding protein [Ralstonia]|jgi:branched-chain amino acid transport system substrate-binding protein|uniref:Leucine-binding protein domain-containing protein n=3 Tax=Ralstonia TaxID=48736 RepID=A0AAD2F3X0_9RALS|nr:MULTISPECIES: ABC transporter substrate-binding protein [Ralstonia]MBE3032404.1 ABC transporter substrate-binding protein [Actinomycetota bacterium]MEA3271373.1 ABC transporter substrate-binding protein [Pseudomonadota bacterium]ENZ76519.1 amino acid/amide ABC transporter substrate-binding protein, HAAT family [Ralstonia pickettii OR214]MBB0025511.1 ABC transporter permease [Ralstonia pickettii]MBB0036309.1 ABC transporter permease [Ralstonia pickettii]